MIVHLLSYHILNAMKVHLLSYHILNAMIVHLLSNHILLPPFLSYYKISTILAT